jgi:tetratricopeptide (TPR) repeat protein
VNVRVTSAWAIALAVLGSACFGAGAQSLAKPKEFYFDEDKSTTRAVVAVPGEGDAVVDKLAAMVQRDSRANEARAQLATLAFNGGRRELGEQLYQGVLGSVPSNGQLYRSVVWNYAWDLLHAGDADKAVEQWALLANGRPPTPEWLPPTLALALWQGGHKDEALQWYGAAVRTWPDKWNDAGNFATLLPDWREADRSALAEVLAAWQANPPAWP